MSPRFFARTRRRILAPAGVLVTAAVLVLAGSTPASAGNAHPAVRASINVLRASVGHIHVTGWSVDPYRSGKSNSENVIVDGVSVALPMADKIRPDVNKALHVTGRHGFDVTVKVRAGTHQVCVVTRPLASTGGQERLVACRTVHVG